MHANIPKIFHNIEFTTASVQSPQLDIAKNREKSDFQIPMSDSHVSFLDRSRFSQEFFFKDWNVKTWCEDDFLQIISQKDWHIPHGEHLLTIGAWAIVSDIIRIYALYTEGGVYADWDVEFLQALPSYMLEYRLVLGFEPYTIDGRSTAQVGFQCCMSMARHEFWRALYKQIQDTLWTSDYDILPGIGTRLLVAQFALPNPRSAHVYYYLQDGITILPFDILYPNMGTRNLESHDTREGYGGNITSHTIALHWEYSQMKDANEKKQGWTTYLALVKRSPEL